MTDDTDPRDSTESRRDVLKKGAIATGAIAIGSLAASGTAAADSPDVTKTDLTGRVYPNLCTDEKVEITEGTMVVWTDTTVDEQGGVHVRLKKTWKGVKGVGIESGGKYRITNSYSQTVNVKGSYPMTGTFVENGRAISQGSAPDLYWEQRNHVTVNANGDVTVSEGDFVGETTCGG